MGIGVAAHCQTAGGRGLAAALGGLALGVGGYPGLALTLAALSAMALVVVIRALRPARPPVA